MSVERQSEDEVTRLAKRVEKARGRLAYQFDPALTEVLSEDELRAERELAERIREQERDQRWKHVQAVASASDRARHTSEEIAKADMRDLLMARKAIAAQRRESSPHAKLASLYKHRAWSLRALAGVVVAGMLWSAVNVQHNIAPGGVSSPLYWFSYLLEGMISVCLIIVMIGTNKVAEWGILDSRARVAVAELALLSLTVGLNTYPYLRSGDWYQVGVHAIAPCMIGVALLIHDAASARYGQAIAIATDQVRELPDPVEQIRRTIPTFVNFIRQNSPEPTKVVALPALPGVSESASAEPKSEDEQVDDAETVAPERVASKPAAQPAKQVAPAQQPAQSQQPEEEAPVDADIWLPPKSADRNGARGWTTQIATAADEDGLDYEGDSSTGNIYDTGQFRIAETLEQELAELRAERRRAREKNRTRSSVNGFE